MSKKIIIASASVVIGVLILLGLGVFPLLEGIKKNSKELEEQYVKVQKASLAEIDVVEYLKFVKLNKESFEAIENIFVDGETPIGFIQFIEEIAESSNLIVKITPGTPKKQKGDIWPVMDFHLTSSASYPAFLRFLTKLESGPHLLLVQNTSLVRDRSSQNSVDSAKEVSFNVLVEVFTGPLPKVSKP
ncbi:MAG: hypothetical protein O3C23_01170 [bacterium]|nr:hypothetical protein [bacterium]